MSAPGDRPARTPSGAPVFSLLVPVYNVARYLPAFLASLAGQAGGSDLEVVLVDDGSTDDSAAVLSAWLAETDLNARLIRQPNRGLSEARNTGLAAATGTWVSFPDPDDELTPGYLATVREFLAHQPTEPDLVVTHALILDDATGTVTDSHPLHRKFRPGDRVVDLRRHPETIHLQAASAFYRRDRIEQAGLRFDGAIRPSFEDASFTALYLCQRAAPTVGVVASAHYLYRRRFDGSSLVQRAWAQEAKYTTLVERGYLGLLREVHDAPRLRTALGAEHGAVRPAVLLPTRGPAAGARSEPAPGVDRALPRAGRTDHDADRRGDRRRLRGDPDQPPAEDRAAGRLPRAAEPALGGAPGHPGRGPEAGADPVLLQRRRPGGGAADQRRHRPARLRQDPRPDLPAPGSAAGADLLAAGLRGLAGLAGRPRHPAALRDTGRTDVRGPARDLAPPTCRRGRRGRRGRRPRRTIPGHGGGALPVRCPVGPAGDPPPGPRTARPPGDPRRVRAHPARPHPPRLPPRLGPRPGGSRVPAGRGGPRPLAAVPPPRGEQLVPAAPVGGGPGPSDRRRVPGGGQRHRRAHRTAERGRPRHRGPPRPDADPPPRGQALRPGRLAVQLPAGPAGRPHPVPLAEPHAPRPAGDRQRRRPAGPGRATTPRRC